MNLFYIDKDPQKCAEWSVDSHCVKMILEAAQLLSTAHRILDGKPIIEERTLASGKVRNHTNYEFPSVNDKRNTLLYKATHINHPCAIWVRTNQNNYAWAWQYLKEHCDEYTHRYGKIHKVEREGLLSKLWYAPKNINKSDSFTPPPNAMDAKYIISDDTTDNYKNYYVVGKEHLHKWTKRTMPKWMQQYANMNTWRT